MKTMLKSCFAIFALILTYGSLGHAEAGSGIRINPSLLYLSFEQKTATTTASSSYVGLNAGVAYQFPNPLFVGATYTYLTNALTSGGVTTNTTLTGYGPTVGVAADGFALALTYVFSSDLEQKPPAGSSTKYTSGSGFLAQLSYRWMLGSSFSLGPEIAYRSIKYTKVNTGSGDVTADFTDTNILPYLSMGFMF